MPNGSLSPLETHAKGSALHDDLTVTLHAKGSALHEEPTVTLHAKDGALHEELAVTLHAKHYCNDICINDVKPVWVLDIIDIESP